MSIFADCETASQRRIDAALNHADDTQSVFLGQGMIARVGECFRSRFESSKVKIVADRVTFDLVGRRIETDLRNEGVLGVESAFLFPEGVHADRENLDRLRAVLAETDAIPIAVGSGTINDLTKRAAFETERSYMVVATAASMDGYTAFGASIELNGFKQTMNCPAPRIVLADIDILCGAPCELNAAGYADLLAKIPAGADWILADFIGTEPLDFVAWHIVQDQLRDCLAKPEEVIAGEKRSILGLFEGLILSGLAMQKAKSSRTASGAEHLFSHLWDNQHHTFCGKTPFHGFKVGIGSMLTSRLYEEVFKLSETDFIESGNRIESFYRPWSAIEQAVKSHFGTNELAKQVLEQSRRKHASIYEAKRRLAMFAENWSELRRKLLSQVVPALEIRDMLRRSGAPFEPEQIGIDRKHLRLSFEQAQLIRCRYNVLDFVLETGNWDRLVPTLF